MKTSFTQKEILEYLEESDQETYHFFIDFEHPYFNTAGSRLTLYADAKRWAIVFEKSGYANRSYDGEIELAYFGNCLINLQAEGERVGVTSNCKYVTLINNVEMARIENGNFELASKNVSQVRVRDSLLNIKHNKSVYENKNIKIRAHSNPQNLIDIPSLIRYLDEQHPNLFRATDNELRKCLPADLPKIMKIEEWHHEAYSKYKTMTSPTNYKYEVIGEQPSKYETYRMIADILISRDSTKWRPTLKPNNNWRNWPNAGNM